MTTKPLPDIETFIKQLAKEYEEVTTRLLQLKTMAALLEADDVDRKKLNIALRDAANRIKTFINEMPKPKREHLRVTIIPPRH